MFYFLEFGEVFSVGEHCREGFFAQGIRYALQVVILVISLSIHLASIFVVIVKINGANDVCRNCYPATACIAAS